MKVFDININKKKFFVISCDVFYRAICYLCSQSPNITALHFIDKKTHDSPELVKEKLKDLIKSIKKESFDAILLAFGLCGNATDGLIAGDVPIVIPRAHDCNSILLGDCEKYNDIITKTPGTLWASAGYLETRNNQQDADNEDDLFMKNNIVEDYQALVDKYGEDNAKYVFETLNKSLERYEQIVFINTDLTDTTQYINNIKEYADKKNYKFKLEPENLSLLSNLINGNWNDNDFLIVPSGAEIKASHCSKIFKIK